MVKRVIVLEISLVAPRTSPVMQPKVFIAYFEMKMAVRWLLQRGGRMSIASFMQSIGVAFLVIQTTGARSDIDKDVERSMSLTDGCSMNVFPIPSLFGFPKAAQVTIEFFASTSAAKGASSSAFSGNDARRAIVIIVMRIAMVTPPDPALSSFIAFNFSVFEPVAAMPSPKSMRPSTWRRPLIACTNVSAMVADASGGMMLLDSMRVRADMRPKSAPIDGVSQNLSDSM